MPLNVPCLSCGAKIRVADKYLGKQIRCPRCNMGVLVKQKSAEGDSASESEEFNPTIGGTQPSTSRRPPTNSRSIPPKSPIPIESSSAFESDAQMPDEHEFIDQLSSIKFDDLEFIEESPLDRSHSKQRRIGAQEETIDPDPFDEELQPLPPRIKKKKKSKEPEVSIRPAKHPKSNSGDLLVWVLLTALLPLMWMVIFPPLPLDERIREALKSKPELRSELGDDNSDELLELSSDFALPGAHLSRNSKIHWVYAVISAAAFLGIFSAMRTHTQVRELWLLIAGIATGTIGVLMLIVFQFLAEMSLHSGLIGGGIASLIMMILRLIGFSYRCAMDPNTGLLVSFFGFTCGVGFCEEVCKILPVRSYLLNNHKTDWRSACLLGFASGAGFGVSEGIMYSASYYNGIEPGLTYLVRFTSCVALHSIWCGSVALIMFGNQEELEFDGDFLAFFIALLRYVSIAMVLHGLYDTVLKKELLSVALLVAIASFAWLAWLSRYYWDYESE